MDVVGLITSLASGSAITYVLGWLAGRKRYKADLESIKLKNVEATITIYQKVSSDLRNELTSVSNRCVELTTEVELLRKENKDILKRLDDSQKSNKSLEKSNLELKMEVAELNKLLSQLK